MSHSKPTHLEKVLVRLRYAFGGLQRDEINNLVKFVETISEDIKIRRFGGHNEQDN